jgi:hypothetical protein
MEFDTILPVFQEFLRANKLVPEKYIPYYAYWLGKFIHFSNKNISADHKKLMLEFIDSLQKERAIQDWQIRQADKAVRLYLVNFKGKIASDDASLSTPADATNPDISQVMEEMKRSMRLKHYSYSTERTYLDWATRFFRYVQTTKGDSGPVVSDDIKQYLSHLAINRRVSASTQNQAFNALLFLFRDVLGQDVGNLGNTVRAKRGSRHPVVLTPDEVGRYSARCREQVF